MVDLSDRRQFEAACQTRSALAARGALLLAFGRGLSARGIALRTSLPLGTAKSRIRLGLAKTRAQSGEAAA
jgi:DNA-directed RNA polymerase specialized sigma24 family protein